MALLFKNLLFTVLVPAFSFVEGVLQDEETSSRWDDGGRAISGSITGSQLVRVPSRTSFWFSLVGSLPDVELYTP